MSKLAQHFAYDTGNYRHKLALGLSIGFHLIVLVAGAILSYRSVRHEPPPMIAQKVRLGGPPNMELGGKEHKAPVVGRAPKKTQPKTNNTKTKSPPKAKEKQIPLKKPENNKKPPPKKKEPEATDNTNHAGSATPTPAPPPDDDTRNSPRAIGGMGGKSGVSVDIGDGAPDSNVDADFANYYKVVQARLLERWSSAGLKGGSTKVRFHIDREGKVSQTTVVESSGYPHLDSPAKRAVMGAKFPPLPQSYQENELILSIIFNYDRK